MAQQTLNANGETHGSIRGKINANFDELYGNGISESDVLFIGTHDFHVGHATGHGATRALDLTRQISNIHPPFVFINGDFWDLGAGGTDAAYLDHGKRVLNQLQCPRYFSLGNHDNANGDSLTDCDPANVAAFFDSVEDSHTRNLDYNDNARTLGYYHFVKNGVDYIVLNTVELQAPSEGDYGIRDAQKQWLTDTLDSIQGADKRLVVFSHVDPSASGMAWYRIKQADRDYIQNALQHWSYTSGGKLLAVISAHEHGINSAHDNRAQVVKDVWYANRIDGRFPNGDANIKAQDYDSGALLAYYKARWDEATSLFKLEGGNGSGDLSYTHNNPSGPAAQAFDGVAEYHDTGIIPDATTEMVIVGKFRSVGSSFKVHGCSETVGSVRFYMGLNNGNWALGYNTYAESVTAGDTNEHEFKINSNGLYVDDVLVQAAPGAISGITAPIYLCAHNTAANNGFCDFDLKHAVIKHQGQQHYFYPALTTS